MQILGKTFPHHSSPGSEALERADQAGTGLHWLAIGEALLSHVSTLLQEHGAAQIVVACADRDLAKAEVLRRFDLTIASNWWTKPLG